MKKNDTKTESWSIEDLVNAITDTTNKNKIVIPKFQRNLVWSGKQKKEFIDSIKKGFPVGALLLFKTETEKDITKFNLIDGLQRTTTLKQYSEAPTDKLFFDGKNIDEDLLKKLLFLIDKPDLDESSLSSSIVEWVTGLKGFEESKGFSSADLTTYLNKTLDLDMDLDSFNKFREEAVSFVEDIKNDSNISSFNIPLLIYSGPVDNLPLIFERLNSKGTQLNKYQIYAAAWTDEPFEISNTRIIAKIKAKYESLISEGYEVDNFDPDNFNTSKFSCFEYIFGFGKLLCEEYPLLFSGNAKEEKEDSIGFNIVNLCLGKPFSEMKTLPQDFAKYDTVQLESSIIDAIEFVNNALKAQLGLKMNNKKDIPIVHTEMQIVSIVGKVFHSKYDKDLNIKSSWNEKKDKLKENLKYHYLYDILKESWKGSGDTRAYRLVKEDYYEIPITKQQWLNIFEEWLNSELQKREKKRIAIKTQSILFLKYLYVKVLLAEHQTSDLQFDMEHIVPVEKLKSIAGEDGIPISAFPNLCLLDKSLNAKKQSKTFYEFIETSVENAELTEAQAAKNLEKIEAYSFTEKGDLEFVTTKDKFTPENYEDFLKKRHEILVNKFLDLYDIV
ncbi:DUF262 domain-containing protein [uncultured Psychrobacter sp.]|uniref:DUF262 domain-containing protein n=1 Tax=uncultured Psychrobacter sp. TaxID=259303 RepID=UPI0025915BA2|nr:DUF262 domain-containing protein [uncultured Psychrobacter sp.]